MPDAKFLDPLTTRSEEEDCSCDLNPLYKLSFPFPSDAPFDIWL